MYGPEMSIVSIWWLIPIAMMILCIFMMRRPRGSKMCGLGSCGTARRHTDNSESSLKILEKRYASGEINAEEYLEKKRALTGSPQLITE